MKIFLFNPKTFDVRIRRPLHLFIIADDNYIYFFLIITIVSIRFYNLQLQLLKHLQFLFTFKNPCPLPIFIINFKKALFAFAFLVFPALSEKAKWYKITFEDLDFGKTAITEYYTGRAASIYFSKTLHWTVWVDQTGKGHLSDPNSELRPRFGLRI